MCRGGAKRSWPTTRGATACGGRKQNVTSTYPQGTPWQLDLSLTLSHDHRLYKHLDVFLNRLGSLWKRNLSIIWHTWARAWWNARSAVKVVYLRCSSQEVESFVCDVVFDSMREGKWHYRMFTDGINVWYRKFTVFTLFGRADGEHSVIWKPAAHLTLTTADWGRLLLGIVKHFCSEETEIFLQTSKLKILPKTGNLNKAQCPSNLLLMTDQCFFLLLMGLFRYKLSMLVFVSVKSFGLKWPRLFWRKIMHKYWYLGYLANRVPDFPVRAFNGNIIETLGGFIGLRFPWEFWAARAALYLLWRLIHHYTI